MINVHALGKTPPTPRLVSQTAAATRPRGPSGIIRDFRRLVDSSATLKLRTSTRDIAFGLRPADDALLRSYGLDEVNLPMGRLTWIRMLGRSEAAYACLSLEGATYLLSLSVVMPFTTFLQIWTREKTYHTPVDISYCDFTYNPSTLHIYDTRTRASHRGGGLNATLQRLAYVMAGKPRLIVRHQTMHTNPDFSHIASAFLDSGYFASFFPNHVADSMSRRFDVEVTCMDILNGNSIRLHLDRSYEVSVHRDSAFDIRYSVIPRDSAR